MNSKAKNDSLFRPTMKLALFLFLFLAALFFVLIKAVYIFATPQTIQLAQGLASATLSLLASLVCFPFYLSTLSVEMSRDGIKGSSSFLPFFATRVSLSWPLIKKVEKINLIFFSYYKIYHQNEETFLIIPEDLENVEVFFKELATFIPESSPLHLLKDFTRSDSHQLSIKGHLCDQYKESLPFHHVLLKKNQVLVLETRTTVRGDFYFVIELPAGEYTVSSIKNFAKVESNFKLENELSLELSLFMKTS